MTLRVRITAPENRHWQFIDPQFFGNRHVSSGASAALAPFSVVWTRRLQRRPSALEVSNMGLTEPIGNKDGLSLQTVVGGIVFQIRWSALLIFVRRSICVEIFYLRDHWSICGSRSSGDVVFPGSKQPRRYYQSCFPRQFRTIAEYLRKANRFRLHSCAIAIHCFRIARMKNGFQLSPAFGIAKNCLPQKATIGNSARIIRPRPELLQNCFANVRVVREQVMRAAVRVEMRRRQASKQARRK